MSPADSNLPDERATAAQPAPAIGPRLYLRLIVLGAVIGLQDVGGGHILTLPALSARGNRQAR